MRRRALRGALYLAILLGWGLLRNLPAQDALRGGSAAPASPANVESQPGDAPGPPKTIYVPFDQLGGTFEQPDANVLIPYADYRRLLQAWRAGRALPATPNAVLTRAEYAVTADERVARIHVRLNVKVMEKSWAEVPLRFGDAAVGRVDAPENVLMRGMGNGQYALLVSQPGEYQVDLELATQVRQSPDGRELTFECPAVALSTLDVTVPRADQAVDIKPQVVALPADGTGADVTHVRANVGSTQRITVTWRPRTGLTPAMDLLASANNRTLVTVADGLVHTDAWLTYDILRGELGRVRILVPARQRILDLNADGRIRNWTVAEQNGNQVVTIELLNPAQKQLTVEIHTESRLEEAELTVAGLDSDGRTFGIHALDVVRESGQIAIRHSSDLVLTVAQQQGVVRIESAEVDRLLQGANALAYKFYSPQLTLRLTVRPVEPRITVVHQASFIFEDDELRTENVLHYSVERTGVFELRLRLPEGLLLDAVVCNAMKEYSLDEASRTLAVSLTERTQGDIELTVRGHRGLPAPAQSFPLPILEPLNVERETGSVLLFARNSVEVRSSQDQVQSAQHMPFSPQAGVGGAMLTSAWSFTRRPVVIPVETTRKPTRLSAQVGTSINVQPELTQVRTQVDFLVEYSGLDTFRIEVPESISSQVRIELEPSDTTSVPIKQKIADDPNNGRVVWTVLTQRESFGRQRFVVSYDLPRAEAAGDAPISQTVELIRPLGLVNPQGEPVTPLTRTQGEVSLDKDQALSISAQASGGGIEQIDIRELVLLPKSGTLAYRYFRHDVQEPVTVTITTQRFEIQPVVSTVVSRGLVEVVAGTDQEATYRCRFRLQTSQRQRLLVFLPVNLEVLAAFVNDREVKLEKADASEARQLGQAWAPFWVNVARPDSSDKPFLLTFQFLWSVKPTLSESRFGRGTLTLPLPLFGTGGQSVVQELKVVIWAPDDYVLVGDPENFELQRRSRRLSFLLGEGVDRQVAPLNDWVTQELPPPRGVSSFPTEGRLPYAYTNLGGAQKIEVGWWNRLAMTLVFSLALALMGWILLTTSWENKLGFLLLLAFLAAIYGLYDSHSLSESVRAARFGLAFLLGLWLIHGLLGRNRRVREPRSRIEQPTPVPYAVIPPPGVFERLHEEKPREVQ